MKRLFLLLLCCSLVLSGCFGKPAQEALIPQVAPATVPVEPTGTIPPEPATLPVEIEYTEMLSVAVPTFTETFALEDGTELFNYTAQNMQLLLPDKN